VAISVALVLASAALAAAPATLVEEVIVVHGEWRPHLEPGGAPYLWKRFELPRGEGSRHIRLAFPAGARVWLNGVPLTITEYGDADVTDFVVRGRSNLLVIRGGDGKAELRITPRVYIARSLVQVHNGRLTARLWVRNTLENTVNVFASVLGEGVSSEVTATVPPDVTQVVAMETAILAPPKRVRLAIEKQEEAMEGGYRFETTAPVR